MTPFRKAASFRLLYRDSLFYFVGKGLAAVVIVVSTPILLRLLGRESFGEYSVVYSTVLIIGGGACALLTQPMLKYGSRLIGPDENTVFTSVVQRSLYWLSAAAFLSTALVVALFLKATPWVVLAAALFAAMQVMFATASSTRSVMLQPAAVTWGEAGRALITLAALGLCWWWGIGEYFWFLLGQVLAITAGTQILNRLPGGMGPKRGNLGSPGLQSRHLKKIEGIFLRYGVMLSLWMALALSLNYADRYIITWKLGYADVGLYSAIYNLAFPGVGLLLAPVVFAAHPRLMRNWNEGNRAAGNAVLRAGLMLQAGMGAIIVLFAWLLRESFVQLILGEPNLEASRLVLPLVAGSIIWHMGMLVHKPLEFSSRFAVMTWAVVAALLINCLGNVLLLERMGLIAAAYMTLIAAIVYVALVACSLRGRC